MDELAVFTRIPETWNRAHRVRTMDTLVPIAVLCASCSTSRNSNSMIDASGFEHAARYRISLVMRDHKTSKAAWFPEAALSVQ